MRTILATLLALILAVPASAQVIQDPQIRTAIHVASWVTVLTAEALDTWASWKSPNRTRTFVLQGVRVGVTEAAVARLKWAAPTPRPCAPTHQCGSDSENSAFPSGHMALACSTLGGPSLSVTVPLAGATALGRYLSWRHLPSQLAAGCIVGALASRIR